ncbi:MAG: metallophosphoesterase [Bacillota bacterium]
MRWIIGDIHGMLKPLEMLVEMVRRADSQAQFIFAGDYINRGPDSRAVIDLLLSLADCSCFLRGNHDDIFGEILLGQTYTPNASQGNRLLAYKWFMQHGLDNTLTSYGADWAELEYLLKHPDEQRLDQVLQAIPETHRNFIRNLKPIYEAEDFFVAHGKWDPDDHDQKPSLSYQLSRSTVHRELLMWGRFTSDEIVRPKAWNRIGYFSHTPVENYPKLLPRGQYIPIVGPKIVLVDTGVALSPLGRLTAFCHESQAFLQTSHFGTRVTLEMQKHSHSPV